MKKTIKDFEIKNKKGTEISYTFPTITQAQPPRYQLLPFTLGITHSTSLH